MKFITVVAAIITHNHKILCVQRGANKYDYISHKWEFPGGKIEDGESQEKAILREIDEELKLRIEIDKKFITVEHQYKDFNITMHSFLCTCLEIDLQLTEHIDYKWLSINELISLDWAEADIPIVMALIQFYAAK